jgi:lipopolysaccharide/colanic/teichoic acid biosynthesis glycosyltransferase
MKDRSSLVLQTGHDRAWESIRTFEGEQVQSISGRCLDVLASAVGLVLSLPLMAYVALRVGLSSKGPIFFAQERVGQGGRPFRMYKFRSMFIDAEQGGPALAAHNDPRITPFGRIIRKWRLDELPQLWNVLKGDMTLVGPRPERQCYIDRITDHAPNYARLLTLKPGLTSLGIVNFGYASTVQEMIDRQRHDQYYLENKCPDLDMHILLSTLDVILRRKGK